MNEAALLAARREQNEVQQKDFLDALEKIVLGPERPLLLSRDDRERIAYHEGGHAILGLVVPGADPVHRVTIVPRGQALGVTYQRPDSDRYNYPEAYLRARIVGMLGGRAAEEIVYGTQDHRRRERHRAGDRARARHGHALGHERAARAWCSSRRARTRTSAAGAATAATKPFSEETAAAIDAEVQRIIDECHDEARRLLSAHRKQLDALAEALLAARDARRAGDPRGHRASAGAGPGNRDTGVGGGDKLADARELSHPARPGSPCGAGRARARPPGASR